MFPSSLGFRVQDLGCRVLHKVMFSSSLLRFPSSPVPAPRWYRGEGDRDRQREGEKESVSESEREREMVSCSSRQRCTPALYTPKFKPQTLAERATRTHIFSPLVATSFPVNFETRLARLRTALQLEHPVLSNLCTERHLYQSVAYQDTGECTKRRRCHPSILNRTP